MDLKWIQILVILVFYQKITSGADVKTHELTEGQPFEIRCRPDEIGSMVMWFRILDKSGMEYIASFTSNGVKKSQSLHPDFSYEKIGQNILVLKSFKKISDSGAYSCGSIKNNELKFGEVTQLAGGIDPVTVPAPKTIAANPCLSTTTRACICKNNNRKEEVGPSLSCTPIILGPLAGACGLLLLLLIITTLYCNKIRTRRCPHHYKRRPRNMAPEKLMMTNRPV